MLHLKGPPSLATKFAYLAVVATVLVLLIHTVRFSVRFNAASGISPIPWQHSAVDPAELQYMQRVRTECDLSPQTSWRAWRVRSTQSFDSPQMLTQVRAKFGSLAPLMVDTGDPDPRTVRAKMRLDLVTPYSPLPGEVDGSDLIFGVTTTYERLSADDFAMVKAWSRWATNGRYHTNGVSMIVMLDRAEDSYVDEIDTLLGKSGIDAYVTTTSEPMSMARRYYELTRILKTFGANLQADGQQKRWFALIEDDIFFPSLSYLLDRLYAFNSNHEMYVGLPSEKDDWEVLMDHTITTYGGGALFFTKSAISTIPTLPCFSKQSDSGSPVRAKNWDVLLQTCIIAHSELNMHVLPGFYSPNDEIYYPEIEPYETGLQPLLLHHAQQRHELNINKAHLVTNICGDFCFMQKYLFRDNWVLVNGVSISQIPGTITFQSGDESPEPEPDEDERNPDGTYGVKPNPRPKSARIPTAKHVILSEEVMTNKTVMTWKGEKQTWRLMDSAIGKDGAVWQAYVKKGNPSSPREADKIDSVITLIWE